MLATHKFIHPMTEDKFKEAEYLRRNLKEYERVERATKPENDYRLYVAFTGRNDVSGSTIESFLGEDFKQLQSTLNTLTLAAIEARRKKLQEAFDKL